MKKVLILGSGLVARPIIVYLLNKDIHVTVASPEKERAMSMIDNHKNGVAIEWSIDNEVALSKMVESHDLTVSLLPYVFHIVVAKYCLHHKKNMVTTSYVQSEMQALDTQAKEAGIIILNELGLDPGIDHLSAMRIIDKVHKKGGKIDEFYSICGALPAPEAANNPFKYKFSWSPKGVIMAGNNDGSYLKNGQKIYIPTEELFKNPLQIDFKNVGILEVYPNRDSTLYIDIYGIPEVKTIMRGTFRYAGWCEIMDAIKRLKLISNVKMNLKGKTFADLIATLINEKNSNDIRLKVAKFLDISSESHVLDAIEWLGFFDHKPMNRNVDTPFEITSDRMIAKMELGTNERDMVAMQHTFTVSYPDGKQELIRSRMLDYGTPATDTSIARTVALPAAIGVEMILNGTIQEKGVFRPVLPGIYNPILDQLEELNIRLEEEFNLPLSERVIF